MIKRENTTRYIRYTFALAGISIVAFTALSFYDIPLIFDLGIAAVFGALLLSIIISEKRHEIAAGKKREQHLIDSNERLQVEVQEKTAALGNIFERVSDAFVAIDNDWCYTYLNSKAQELLAPGKPPGFLLGKHVFSIIPEAKDSEFHRQAEKAMTTQIYCYVEGYDPRYGRWLANAIYPSPDGLSIFFHDITEKKKAEETLRMSEERYRLLFEQASDAIIITDKNGTILDVNASFTRLLGYSKEEIQGISGSDLVDPGNLKQSPIRLDLLQAGQAISRERKIRHKDGSLVDIELNSKMLSDDRILGIGRNITERKRMETKLREAEKKFRDLVEKSLVGVYILQEGRLVYVNPKVAEIYGYTQYELIGQPVSMMADEEEMKKVNENIRLRLDGIRDSIQYEITGRRKDRSTVNVEVYGSRTEYQGKPAIIGTLIDITERKKTAEALRLSEQKYRLMFEASPLPMFMYTIPQYAITDVNEAAVNYYGYSREEFIGMNLRDLRPEEDIPKFQEVAARPARGSLGVWRHRKKDGTMIHVEIIAHDMHYEGRPARLALAKDITEQLAAEERLQQSYKEIRMLASHLENIREEEKIKIAREIHDELGQQLTIMKIDLSWLSRRPEYTDSIAAEKIKGVLDMLGETVKTVRRIATELRPGILDDLGLAAAMQWQSQEFEKRSGIKTEFIHTDTDIRDSSLSTGLFRIFQESLTNVARHADATQVNTSLTLADNELILKVTDNGHGFDISSIGEKHTLGLLGMKERAMIMGGRYNIISEHGKGTTVVVSVKLSNEKSKQSD